MNICSIVEKRKSQKNQTKAGSKQKMASFVGFDVLEVVSLFNREEQATANGIKRVIKVAKMRLEGAEMSIPIADGVDVPIGWSGKALCLARPINYTKSFDNRASTKFAYEPFQINQFKPIAKVETEDPFKSFFNSPAPQATVENSKK